MYDSHGQVVIPKKLRDELGIQPGDEVSFGRQEGVVIVRPVSGVAPLRGRYRGSSLTAELMAERAADQVRDDRRDHRP